MSRAPAYERVEPGTYEPENHFYPRVLNAQIHPLVRFFMSLTPERIVARYVHLNPKVDGDALMNLLTSEPKHFRWSGCDLLHVTTENGSRRMVVVETNSCPSGQKSMPYYEEHDELGGYRNTLNRSFMPSLKGRRLPPGELAVIYDKNYMEASGYAAAMADISNDSVHLVEFPAETDSPRARFTDGVLEVLPEGQDEWVPIRCAFRYVTQRPWTRMPVATKTAILNPVVACLAGGRNKAVAAKAYEFFNSDLLDTGLSIRTPHTLWDVGYGEIPLWVANLGGQAVVKVPYANAGQGVYTITTKAELDEFLELEQRYDRFIVQSLIGSYSWSSTSPKGRLFHVGTIPNKKVRSYVADLRVMITAGPGGFRPQAIYARRARKPLLDTLGVHSSWDMLGTNLSIKNEDGSWGSDTHRLLLMDRKDFNSLGLGMDELIEAYLQTVLGTLAIDRMASNLINKKGGFRRKLFRSLNDDPALLEEIVR